MVLDSTSLYDCVCLFLVLEKPPWPSVTFVFPSSLSLSGEGRVAMHGRQRIVFGFDLLTLASLDRTDRF